MLKGLIGMAIAKVFAAFFEIVHSRIGLGCSSNPVGHRLAPSSPRRILAGLIRDYRRELRIEIERRASFRTRTVTGRIDRQKKGNGCAPELRSRLGSLAIHNRGFSEMVAGIDSTSPPPPQSRGGFERVWR